MDKDDIDEFKEYRWETGYERTWEAIQENEAGILETAFAGTLGPKRKRAYKSSIPKNKLRIMRNMYVLVDCSEYMLVPDLRPTRFLRTLKLLKRLVVEYYDQNPISQMGIIILHDKRARKISSLSGTPKPHLRALEALMDLDLIGEPSLQNGLDLALQNLCSIPSHASKEILIIMGSLNTCDPGDINETIDKLKSCKIRCSTISLSAEIYVCRNLANETGGAYCAILDDGHYQDQVLSYIDPPEAVQDQQNSLIKMGFPYPQSKDGRDLPLSMCICHLENSENPSKYSSAGYHCPQCFSKYCELPIECQICGLTLVSAPHLARSYHHLLPVRAFTELMYNGQAATCYACQRTLQTTKDDFVYRCETCSQIYCADCDTFIHCTLHICIGCNVIPSVAERTEYERLRALQNT